MNYPIFRFYINFIANESNPNWFDILSLIITVMSIIGAYLTSRFFYKKEKIDSELERKEILNAEINLFENSLIELKKDLLIQIEAINEYLKNEDFSLSLNPNINIEFLKYIDIKSLYKIKNIEEKMNLTIINELLAQLFFLKDFHFLIKDELQVFIKRFNQIERDFFEYKKLLYTDYLKLSNKRAASISFVEENKVCLFHQEDVFIRKYSELINSTFHNAEIIKNEELISRKKLDEKFIYPLIHICKDYIPEDFDSIEISYVANKVHSAFIDMEKITESHFTVINSYKLHLEKIIEKIEIYKK